MILCKTIPTLQPLLYKSTIFAKINLPNGSCYVSSSSHFYSDYKKSFFGFFFGKNFRKHQTRMILCKTIPILQPQHHHVNTIYQIVNIFKEHHKTIELHFHYDHEVSRKKFTSTHTYYRFIQRHFLQNSP